MSIDLGEVSGYSLTRFSGPGGVTWITAPNGRYVQVPESTMNDLLMVLRIGEQVARDEPGTIQERQP